MEMEHVKMCRVGPGGGAESRGSRGGIARGREEGYFNFPTGGGLVGDLVELFLPKPNRPPLLFDDADVDDECRGDSLLPT